MNLFYETNAPLVASWLSVWLFAFLGGLATAFIKIDEIDGRLRYPFISKPLIGTVAGVAMSVVINGQTEPPPINLSFWAFVGSVCSTPIITGFLIFISDQKRQNEFYESAKDKFIPFKKERNDE